MAKKNLQKKKVLIALSGGVDSAVSAYLLLKRGYEVEAAFMKNWSSTEGLLKNECPWLFDRREALRVAAFLRLPLHTLDFEKQYEAKVMKYFFEEYKKGRTPNPDVMCNKEIKFKLLYDWAMENGFDYLATGHYAQIGNRYQASGKSRTPSKDPHRSTLVLLRSVDEFKDQTYFIYNIKSTQLPHLFFPIGGMKKNEVKKMGEKIGLPNAGRKESMGLCFVGKIRLRDFLGQKIKPQKGPIIGPKGEILGQHEGLANYTIGQRQGIKVGPGGPYYVYNKDLPSNTLYVTDNPEDKRLKISEISIHSVHWISKPQKSGAAGKITARYRHQGDLLPVKLKEIGKGVLNVIFDKPQKAIASGQSLVLYQGQVCLGGGIIT